MKINRKRQLCSFLISVLVFMSGAPYLTFAAAADDFESQGEGYLTCGRKNRNGLEDEDLEEYKYFAENYASVSNLKKPSEENLASPANLASASQAAPVLWKTAVFTDAAPFLPPVSGDLPHSQASGGLWDRDDLAKENGLVLNKTVQADGDNEGEYKIRLEAYSTGRPASLGEIYPADIVLVLDQSKSMALDFEGRDASSQTDTRQHGMKQAVYQLITIAAERFRWVGSDHRIAIVAFGEGASVVKDWTFVDSYGEKDLLDAVDSLEVSSSEGADAAAAMEEAENLMHGGYQYPGGQMSRQKAVIVLTDGVPMGIADDEMADRDISDGGLSGFNTEIADQAIQWAKKLKDEGTAVYSVGIFCGADPDELHGGAWKRKKPLADVLCTGQAGSSWGGPRVEALFGGNDFAGIDIAAGNRFLNYLSANSMDAEGIGLDRDLEIAASVFGTLGPEYTITENYSCKNNGYYLTADGQDTLTDIFSMIGQNISVADVFLGEETVIDDEISPYFELADDGGILVETADYLGGGRFADSGDEQPGIEAKIEKEEGKQGVSVTGFSFDENYITEDARQVNGTPTRGKKIIITFNIKPRDGFLGGNGVPVSMGKSGIYGWNDGQDILVGKFESPNIDIPIPELAIEALPKDVYCMGLVTDEDYQAGASVKCGTVAILGPEKDAMEDWQGAYVVLPDSSDITVDRPSEPLFHDAAYTLSCTISPKKEGMVSSETGASEAADIRVYQPTAVFHDGEIFYGEALADNYGQEPEIIWKHRDEEKAGDIIMAGEEPRLSFAYRCDPARLADGKVNVRDVLPVTVSAVMVALQDNHVEDITDYVTLTHQDCAAAQGQGEMADYPGYHFLLHVRTGSLTIKKAAPDGMEDGLPFVFTIKKDGVPYTQCVVLGNGAVTISQLPLGNYEIEEEWGKGTLAWRYGEPEYSAKQAELTKDYPFLSFTSVSRMENEKWLNGTARTVHERKTGRNPYPLADTLAGNKILAWNEEWLRAKPREVKDDGGEKKLF